MTQWNQMHLPTDGGGGTQVYPGSGEHPGPGGSGWGGSGATYTPPPGTTGQTAAHGADTSGGGSGLSTGGSRHHRGRHSGSHKAKKVHIWHAPKHPSHRRALPPGIEDQTF